MDQKQIQSEIQQISKNYIIAQLSEKFEVPFGLEDNKNRWSDLLIN